MKQRTHLSPSQKMIIVREHLENNQNISEIAEKHRVGVQDIYRWKKQLFESVEVFERKKSGISKEEQKLQDLENKLKTKDSVISELAADNIALKKKLNGDR
jgi:transposase-like protein